MLAAGLIFFRCSVRFSIPDRRELRRKPGQSNHPACSDTHTCCDVQWLKAKRNSFSYVARVLLGLAKIKTRYEYYNAVLDYF